MLRRLALRCLSATDLSYSTRVKGAPVQGTLWGIGNGKYVSHPDCAEGFQAPGQSRSWLVLNVADSL